MILRLTILSLMLGLIGCAAPNYHSEHYASRFKQYGYGYTPEQSTDLKAENKNVNSQILKKYTNRIAFELAQQVNIKQLPSVVVASFVDLDDSLTNTHALGNKIAEDLVISLQERGYQVVDVNVSKQVILTPQGNFVFNREESKLPAQFVISGIVNYSPTGANINTRLVDTKSGTILAAYSITMPTFVIEHAFPILEGQNLIIKGK